MEEEKLKTEHLKTASKEELEDRFHRRWLLVFFGFVVAFVGITAAVRDHVMAVRDQAVKAGYRSACADMAHSNRKSDDCEIALFKGICSIVCANDTNIESKDLQQLDQHQGLEAEGEEASRVPSKTEENCQLYGDCKNTEEVAVQPATRVECKHHKRKDGALVVNCPQTEASEAGQIIVPSR